MSVQQKRKNELVTIIGHHFNESNVNNITQDMIVHASEVWNSSKTFGEQLMNILAEHPAELYSFIVGWKQHFVDSLQPKNLKKDWMQDGNKTLRGILEIE